MAHCDTNISSLPGERRSLQAAPPYAVTAQVVFALQMNGSLFRRNKLHLVLVVATSEKERALELSFRRTGGLRKLERVNGNLEPIWLFLL